MLIIKKSEGGSPNLVSICAIKSIVLHEYTDNKYTVSNYYSAQHKNIFEVYFTSHLGLEEENIAVFTPPHSFHV